jgi:hypothetical protein
MKHSICFIQVAEQMVNMVLLDDDPVYLMLTAVGVSFLLGDGWMFFLLDLRNG